jgi:hypothetical protein
MGRTGIIIAAYLTYAGIAVSGDDAIARLKA